MLMKLQAMAMLASCKMKVVLMNIEQMLNPSNEGAAGGDGALSQVKTMVDDYGKAGYSIISTAFIYIVGIGLIGACIGMFIHSNNQAKLSEAKAGLGWKIVAGILGFAGVSIIILMQSIGSSLISVAPSASGN